MPGTLPVGLDLIRSQYGMASKLATYLGLRRHTISQWRQVPAHHVEAVAVFLGVPNYRIRPDLWPPPGERRRPR